MNIKLRTGEDLTVTTKGGYTVTVPDKTGTVALLDDAELFQASYSEWSVTPSTYDGHEIVLYWDSRYSMWQPGYYSGSLFEAMGVEKGNGESTALSWTAPDDAYLNISATRSVTSYIIGDQHDKPIQAAGTQDVIVSKNGDTTVKSVNGGTATIHADLGLGPPAIMQEFTFSYDDESAGGVHREISFGPCTFKGPFVPTGDQDNTYYTPSTDPDPDPDWGPSNEYPYFWRDVDGKWWFQFYFEDPSDPGSMCGASIEIDDFDTTSPSTSSSGWETNYQNIVNPSCTTITITRSDLSFTKTIATVDQIPSAFDHLVSQDGSTTVTAQNNGTVTIVKPGASIDMNDPLSSLIDYLDMPDGSTFDEVRQALGLSVNATLQDAANAVPSSINQIVATLDDLETKLDADQRNIVPYAASADLTLDPETAVYRLSPTGTGIAIPAPVDTAVQATDGYYQFEIELAVPSTATSLTGPSGWTWLPGFELPTYGYAGKTLYIGCRLDCRTRAVTASCWRVA